MKTEQEKIFRIMQDLKVGRKVETEINHMLNWMVEHEEGLEATYEWFKSDTGSDMPFNEFCYGMWPECRDNYLKNKRMEKLAMNN